MTQNEVEMLWKLEEALWLEGEERFASNMHPHCVMVFPEPVGILVGGAIRASLSGAPRWRTIKMTGRKMQALGPGTVSLA